MTKHLPKLSAVILFIGAILRIVGTGSAAIWFDESNMLYRTTIPFMTLYTEHSERSGDLLLEIILRPLMLISHSVWMLRLPSMLAGLVSLWLVWKLMQRLHFTLTQQVVTSAIVAFLPGLLWMAQDARSYGLLSLLVLASIWFALEGRYLGLLATCGLMVYAHSTGPLFAVAPLVIAICMRPAQLRFVVIVGVLTAIAWIPAVIHMTGYWIIQQPWQPLLTGNWLVYSLMAALFPEFWNPAFMLASFLVLTLGYIFAGIWALTGLFKKQDLFVDGYVFTFMAWFVPVLLLVFACLFLHENILYYRTLMPALFLFSLWLGWELGQKRILSYVFMAPVTAMLLWGLVIWSPADRGAGLDKVASQIRSQWRTGDTLLYTTVTVGLPFGYYLNDLPHRWSDIVSDPYFLGVWSIQRTELVVPVKHSTRQWVVIPVEVKLITPDEQSRLDKLVQHQEPIYSLKYIQTAPVNVYLVEGK